MNNTNFLSRRYFLDLQDDNEDNGEYFCNFLQELNESLAFEWNVRHDYTDFDAFDKVKIEPKIFIDDYDVFSLSLFIN